MLFLEWQFHEYIISYRVQSSMNVLLPYQSYSECRKPLDICTNPSIDHESAMNKEASLFMY